MEEDWQNLFDFSIEDNVFLSLDSEFQQPSSTVVNPVVSEPANPNSDDSLDRVRKRDPRLTCENFLAGRIPCSCPELDDKEEEEDEGVGRKRARTTAARCQVPGCEADISELKGYHKRHRVCLRCANAATVVLDGQIKRYCQQCGKFHILPDFDEGKRSCRRKLERHNRRRRKPVESRRGAEDLQGNMLSEDVACNGEAGKDIFNGVSGGTDRFCLSNPITDTETLLELESGHGSPFDSAAGQKNLGGQNIQCNSILSSVASGEPQIDGSVDNSRSALSSSLCGKNVYSSVCPTGRMSFKLYDWNPAEFPRRLRHQIFQWLASMPVELEGYIRPGCTILTVFIAMPRFMWDKFLGDAAAFLDDLVSAPGSLLSGRGNMLIYLDNAVFQVLKDGNSLIKSKIEMQVPRLHYVHPICFEAGKPMEFIACGSYLSQPKFRFLVSFAGKYLKYDSCLPIPCLKTIPCNEIKGGSDHSSDHQTFKIFIPPMETEIFGPAFIEVENESGISNFIPVLFGDGQICYELKMIQEKIGEFFHSKSNISQFMAISAVSDSCGVFVSIQAAMSELILDIGWLLKEPQLEKGKTHLNSMQIQRLNSLLYFLIESHSVSILEKILQSLKNGMHVEEFCGPIKNISDVDLKLFKKYLSHAKEIIYLKLQSTVDSRTVLHSEATQGGTIPASDFETDNLYTMRINEQDMEMSKEDAVFFGLTVKPNWAQERDEQTLLLKEESIMVVNHSPRLVKRLAVPQKACLHLYPRMIPRRRFFVLVIASVAACCGVCLVFLHPLRMGEFANSVRRCLFGNPKA